ncbi:ABC transporter substrate-binding protein [Nocardioides psychrotolerans]|uniref:Virulence factor Mce family protein n=1 Tax=Nocardioides psychrotolerans TaxID=1005945 RepID=A0A1I3FWJ7_9ACTN|nr:MCE family protein [Nocardioides psychrotolerans]GEP37342.1 ABC transporter substrate-binding protein [Nocardioides psychrotolerans]SFI15452.1 virulence factor Mce family protein [Nocardioides psychrotolerans]
MRPLSKIVTPVIVAVLLVAAVITFTTGGGEGTRTVTAHFPRAVSVYIGTDVRILGVTVGEVTAVVPEGESVRVEIEYVAAFDVPADAQAVIVTPTLVSDRFVQLTPAYTEGKVMADGADIALPDTAVPVELDRIYAALRDLSQTLGPNGVNADGTLDNLLEAGAEGLDGQGARANQMIRDLSEAAATFGEGSGDLFDTVSQLADFTSTLASNDKLVRAFIRRLAGVSSQLSAERGELQGALASVADAVGTVETFVRGNRKALVRNVERLSSIVEVINSEKTNLDDALRIAPVAIGNLVLAYNSESGTIGSRIGVSGNVWDADGFLCSVVQQSALPRISKDLACQIFSTLLEPIGKAPTVPPGPGGRATGAAASGSDVRPEPAERDVVQQHYASELEPSLATLLGGTP